MHPAIRQFPSQHFYEGRLLDAEAVARRYASAGAHAHAPPPDAPYLRSENQGLFGPYTFFDVSHGRSARGGGTSLRNEAEASLAAEIVRQLFRRFPTVDWEGAKDGEGPRIGIITPYRQQLNELRDALRRSMDAGALKKVSISTIDGFQGREKDVIIFSAVRAHGPVQAGPTSIGFVADIRRMNVGLTRARHALLVLGSAASLVSSPDWRALVEDARRRSCVKSTPASFASLFDSLPPIAPSSRRPAQQQLQPEAAARAEAAAAARPDSASARQASGPGPSSARESRSRRRPSPSFRRLCPATAAAPASALHPPCSRRVHPLCLLFFVSAGSVSDDCSSSSSGRAAAGAGASRPTASSQAAPPPPPAKASLLADILGGLSTISDPTSVPPPAPAPPPRPRTLAPPRRHRPAGPAPIPSPAGPASTGPAPAGAAPTGPSPAGPAPDVRNMVFAFFLWS
eukprot:tig00000053_g23487.t1